MAGKKPSAISGREFGILKLLWESGPLTVREVRARLARDEEIPYTTVLGLMQLMEKKGYVRHEAVGKTYRYSASVRRRPTLRLVLRDFISRFFDGSAQSMVSGLAECSELNPEVWEQLQREMRSRREKRRE
ncbi:MAG TPA: BlaI/MecI/CopY family transcriptional regulator [Pirellulales bacterium]|nr:BlaI/MecI/CopY family transcriptional regulator [Pirellulales bacterium]